MNLRPKNAKNMSHIIRLQNLKNIKNLKLSGITCIGMLRAISYWTTYLSVNILQNGVKNTSIRVLLGPNKLGRT